METNTYDNLYYYAAIVVIVLITVSSIITFVPITSSTTVKSSTRIEPKYELILDANFSTIDTVFIYTFNK